MKEEAFGLEALAKPLLRAAQQLSPRGYKPPEFPRPPYGGLDLSKLAADLLGGAGVLAEISDQLPPACRNRSL